MEFPNGDLYGQFSVFDVSRIIILIIKLINLDKLLIKLYFKSWMTTSYHF